MKLKYLHFVRGVSINRIGKIGMVLVTSSFVTFIFLEILRIMRVITNSYVGLITYLLLPTLFVIGLILIPIGWYKYRKSTGKTTKELLSGRFNEGDLAKSRLGATLVRTILIFTIVNILFLSVASMRMLNFMDEAEFCGTACHSVMNPEWVTYQVSPHSRVACVQCHVGEGAGALIDSKLNGTWQMISASLNLYEKPIPTPVHQLRPSRETCEKCHWPNKFYGSKLKSFVTYQNDENSTPLYSTLVLKIDDGEEVGKAGIHWHTNENNTIRYASVDDKREEIIWVEVQQSDGSVKRFDNKRLDNLELKSEEARIMDCVDCHNRATHIYEDPQKAVDKRIRKGMIDKTLPYIKRESVGALLSTFTDSETASEIIKNRINSFYRKNYPNLLGTKGEEINKATEILQTVYKTYVHVGMNIDWNTYPNYLNHDRNSGCFRCHNNDLVDKENNTVSSDCTLCHSMLSYDSKEPFQFIKPVASADKDSAMHIYLQEEFLESFN